MNNNYYYSYYTLFLCFKLKALTVPVDFGQKLKLSTSKQLKNFLTINQSSPFSSSVYVDCRIPRELQRFWMIRLIPEGDGLRLFFAGNASFLNNYCLKLQQ